MTLKIYEYNRCGTCRKAEKYLIEKGISYEKRPIREQVPTTEELKMVLSAMDGNIKKLFNTSGQTYRELNIKEKLPHLSEMEVFELLQSNGNLIKRPFVVGENVGTVGFKAEAWDEMFTK